MSALYALNLALHFYLFLYYPFFLSRKLGLEAINPITITAIVNWPVDLMKRIVGPVYVLDGGMFNPYFNYAIYVENIAFVITYIVTLTFFQIKQRHLIGRIYYTMPLNMRYETKHVRIAEILLFALFAINFLILAKSFGVINWIMNPRVGYQLYRTGNGMFYAFAKSFLSAFICLTFLYAPTIRKLLFRFILVIPIGYLLGSKGYLLYIGILFFIILWFRHYKHLKTLSAIFLPAIFGLMLFLFKPDDMESVIHYFDYYINSTNFYEAMLNGDLSYYWGKIFVTDFWGLVPRNIYPDKPIIYGFLYINEYFFPGGAEATNTPAFGGPVAAYADFGLPGVILSSLFDVKLWFSLYAYSIIFKFKNYRDILTHPIAVFLIILYFAPQFLDFFDFPLNVILFLIIVSVICFGSRLRVNYSRKQISV